jgi:MYXO-CTERM domain-containing protein
MSISRFSMVFCGLCALLALGAAARTAAADCEKPVILLILDKSSSMVTGDVPTGESKWEAAGIAISTIASMFETSIDFGLAVFPHPSECSPGIVVVGVGPSNAAAIEAFLVDPPPTAGNWTPMAQTLENMASYAPLSDPTKQREVVMVTDGWQYCEPYDSSQRFLPVDAAAVLRATGATLHVVGFGDGVDSLTLNRIARDSGTAIPGCNPDQSDPLAGDNCYHQALGLDSLTSALEEIALKTTAEECDGVDNDCDGTVDEDLTRTCTSACGTGTEVCVDGAWTDCDAPMPGVEVCDGVEDEDCDGSVDEGCYCVTGSTQPCGTDVGECVFGTQECIDGVWEECEGGLWPRSEVCDGLDNDCDGTADDDAVCGPGEICIDGECVLQHEPIPEVVPDAGPNDDTGEKPGCGCRVTGRDEPAAPWLLALLLLLALVPLRRTSPGR